uniref:DUF1937 domain-containing protein n=1 Tax=viral metagenome TaxID=1070528 RepID=A0A6M3KAI1_9ZZZZ
MNIIMNTDTSTVSIYTSLDSGKIGDTPMPVAYVVGAYRSKWGVIGRLINILRARRVAIKYWQAGFGVYCPHMNTAFFDGKADDSVWLKGNLAIIKRLKVKTDRVIVLPSWVNSEGSKGEIALAKKRRLTIVYE